MGVDEHGGHWAAEDGASADDNGLGAVENDLVFHEKAHNTGWCTRRECGHSENHPAQGGGTDAIHVLFERDGLKGGSLVDRRGDGVLDEDGVDGSVMSNLVDLGDEFVGGRVMWQMPRPVFLPFRYETIVLRWKIWCKSFHPFL